MRDAHLRFAARPDIPIFISASGPRTLELAGEVADGVILLVGLFPEALAWALEHVDRGAAKADRPRPHIAVFAYGAIDDDEDAAIASARSIAAWFPQTAPVICELAGLPSSLVDEVRERYAGGEFQEAEAAARLLPDSFVRRVALAGDVDQARSASRRSWTPARTRCTCSRSASGGWRRSRSLRREVLRRRSGIGTKALRIAFASPGQRGRKGWRDHVGLHHVAFAHGDDPGPRRPLCHVLRP